jgi:thioredoxin reductase
MSTRTDVAIIGAGPYGLSLSVHLQTAGVDYRIFGHPMDAWRNHMPEGMLLKSDGFASDLYDPAGEYPLSRFCGEQGIAYDAELIPVRLKTFVDYGLAFKDRFVPGLEEKLVSSLTRDGDGFALGLDDGAIIRARRVVAAVGVGRFRFIPAALTGLPEICLSHSYDHHDLTLFAGRRVAVIGGGASAIDLAGLLNERGCEVRLICRREALKFGSPPQTRERSLWQRLRHPRSGLGPGLRSRLCTDAPVLFHFMPEALRLESVRRHLGPAASWRMKEKVDGVPVLSGHNVVGAVAENDRVQLSLQTSDNRRVVVSADHVIAATGYHVDIRRLEFLHAGLISQIACVNETPILSARFESSVKGLYFIGPAAANSFGPLMRFAFGARFASRRLVRILGRRPHAVSSSSGNYGVSEPKAPATRKL